METRKHLCADCSFEADDDSDYCPRCGNLFIKNIKCDSNSKDEAEGVCVICGKPFCSNCGHLVNNIFLCNEHDGYEIYEGMVKIFGTSDEIQIHYVKSCLEENSFHPFIYSKKSTPMHLGGNDQSLINLSANAGEKIINEIKLLVPCNEVLEAEILIKELNI
ncbi:MAG: hypothetical protein BMS9Abin39_0530 [Ignavibacteria bacterium]|nr:MAG: hypothetical protein BMS9Abin39_0530 [Ignavibacteria bacterium]